MSSTSLLPVVLMRGGTSKGVFVRDGDLPAPGPDRDNLLLRLMGSPDPMQLDGLGGSHSSTSKVVAVSASERADCDVEYLFAQVGIDRAQVDYRGNCGNLTTAVGPYAIDEGWSRSAAPSRRCGCSTAIPAPGSSPTYRSQTGAPPSAETAWSRACQGPARQ